MYDDAREMSVVIGTRGVNGKERVSERDDAVDDRGGPSRRGNQPAPRRSTRSAAAKMANKTPQEMDTAVTDQRAEVAAMRAELVRLRREVEQRGGHQHELEELQAELRNKEEDLEEMEMMKNAITRADGTMWLDYGKTGVRPPKKKKNDKVGELEDKVFGKQVVGVKGHKTKQRTGAPAAISKELAREVFNECASELAKLTHKIAQIERKIKRVEVVRSRVKGEVATEEREKAMDQARYAFNDWMHLHRVNDEKKLKGDKPDIKNQGDKKKAFTKACKKLADTLAAVADSKPEREVAIMRMEEFVAGLQYEESDEFAKLKEEDKKFDPSLATDKAYNKKIGALKAATTKYGKKKAELQRKIQEQLQLEQQAQAAEKRATANEEAHAQEVALSGGAAPMDPTDLGPEVASAVAEAASSSKKSSSSDSSSSDDSSSSSDDDEATGGAPRSGGWTDADGGAHGPAFDAEEVWREAGFEMPDYYRKLN